MKTKTLLMSLALIATSMASAENGDLNVDALLSAALKSKNKQYDNGLTVRSASEKDIKDAVQKLGGKATVEMGNTRIEYKKSHSSGVLVGSGADGLVATSNEATTGPIVIQPPVVPKTSITVVGRLGQRQANSVCALKIRTSPQGEILKYGAYTEEDLASGRLSPICTTIGKSLRLKAGLYLLTLRKRNNYNFGQIYSGDLAFSSMFVQLNEDENKVIPLREIAIAKYDGNFFAAINSDFENESEKNKLHRMLYAFGPPHIDQLSIAVHEFNKSTTTLKDMEKICRTKESLKSVTMEECWFYIAPNDPSFVYSTKGINFPVDSGDREISIAADGEFMSVFPGNYQIQWQIDNQFDSTKGILVE